MDRNVVRTASKLSGRPESFPDVKENEGTGTAIADFTVQIPIRDRILIEHLAKEKFVHSFVPFFSFISSKELMVRDYGTHR